MMGKDLIKIDDTPEKVDLLLREKYKSSLFEFAYIIASSKRFYSYLPPSYQSMRLSRGGIRQSEIKEFEDKIKKLRSNIVKLKSDLNDFIEGRERKSLHSKNIFKLNDIKPKKINFFVNNNFIKPLEEFLEFKKDFVVNKPGRKINPKTIIAARWGCLIQKGGYKIEWNLIEGLYDWFWNKLKPHSFYADLDKGCDRHNLLKVQFFNYKEKEGIGPIFKPRKLSAYGPGGVDIPDRPIRNIRDHFEAHFWLNRGITVFGKNLIIVDSEWGLFRERIRSLFLLWPHGSPLTQDEIQLFEDILSGKTKAENDADEIEAYIFYAYKIYNLDAGDIYRLYEKNKLPSLLIFPDLSYYSSLFIFLPK